MKCQLQEDEEGHEHHTHTANLSLPCRTKYQLISASYTINIKFRQISRAKVPAAPDNIFFSGFVSVGTPCPFSVHACRAGIGSRRPTHSESADLHH